MAARARLVATVLVLLSAGCDTSAAPSSPPSSPATSPQISETSSVGADLSPVVVRYLDEFLGVVRENYWDAGAVDWEAVRARLLRFAPADADEPADVHFVMGAVVSEIDRHTYFLAPEEALFDNGPGYRAVEVGQPAPGIRRVVIGSLSGGGPEADQWAADAQQDIAAAADGTCGWIVDLRLNSGGNMWPMLVALGPLLGGEDVGAFSAPDGTITPWRYEAGVAYLGDAAQAGVSQPVPSLGSVPVAVLIGPVTGSSGEAVVVALSGRPNTRSFGDATGGFTTAVASFELSDPRARRAPHPALRRPAGSCVPRQSADPAGSTHRRGRDRGRRPRLAARPGDLELRLSRPNPPNPPPVGLPCPAAGCPRSSPSRSILTSIGECWPPPRNRE